MAAGGKIIAEEVDSDNCSVVIVRKRALWYLLNTMERSIWKRYVSKAIFRTAILAAFLALSGLLEKWNVF